VDFYLVRHGEAVAESLDPQRPLTRVGRQKVERVANLTAARGVQVSVVFHSGILRARQTAEILAESLCPLHGVQMLSGLQSQDDPLITRAELESARASAMLVGHLPHMSRLAALLVHDDPEREVVNFAPATVVCCSKESALWKIVWVLSPP
jgi:phosphohistidine phosphatase